MDPGEGIDRHLLAMSTAQVRMLPCYNHREDAQPLPQAKKLPRLPQEVIATILQQIEEKPREEYHVQLKSCALVCRGWRPSAQQLLHRDIRIRHKDYRETFEMYARKSNSGQPFEGELWRYPRHLKFCDAPPDGYESWLAVPEFQAFIQQSATQITDVSILWRWEVRQLDDVLRYIFLFPYLEKVDLRVCDFRRLAPYGANDRPVPNTLRWVILPHTELTVSCNSPTCELDAFATWLNGSHVEVAFGYALQFVSRRRPTCSVLGSFGPNLRVIAFVGAQYFGDPSLVRLC